MLKLPSVFRNILFFLSISTTLGFGQYVSGVTQPIDDRVQEDLVFQNSLTITADELRSHLYYLASDELGGRELGTEGNLMAARYIAEHFEKLGLAPLTGTDTYFQDVDFTWLYWDEVYIQVREKKYKQLWDFVAFQDANIGGKLEVDDVTFLGYGIDDERYTDYKKAKVENDVILIYDGEPRDKSGNFRISESDQPSEWSTNLQLKLEVARERGAKHVLIVADNLQKIVEENRRQLLGAKVLLGKPEELHGPIDFTYISSTMARDILGEKGTAQVIKRQKCITKKGKSKPVEVKTDVTIVQTKKSRYVSGVNVAAMIEGENHPDEYVFITAHYDHIGQKGRDINNGADDNASGTSSILEIADAYARAANNGHRPGRSVVFMLVTGEEKGLLGSDYYVENPIVPLSQTMVDINVDMVGRIDSKYQGTPKYIYVIGSDRISPQLHEVNEKVNEAYSKLILDYKYNDENDPNRFYYRSDHFNFAKKGIPAIFFFNGTHEDYHRPTDTADKIEYEKMAEIARHIFRLSWKLGDLEERLEIREERLEIRD